MTVIAPSSAVAPPADGRSAARVLYLTHRVPYPPDKGDRIRNFHLLRQMARRGRVWLACLADEEVAPGVTAELHRLCERVSVVPVSRGRWLRAAVSVLAGRSVSEGAFAESGLRRVVREWAGETTFTAAVASASSMAPYLKDLAPTGVPAVIDLVDVDSQKWADFANAARGPKRWLYQLEASRVRKLERRLPGWARAVAVVSRAEADVLDEFAGRGAATVAANGVDLDYFRPESRLHAPDGNGGCHLAEPICVFVGAMDYLPNVDAAVWFAREVWPAIRTRFPAAEFRIVGRKPTPEVCLLGGLPGVTVVGQVADVRPHVAAATVAVVPLRLARGIQNKVLEALAMGKPVVAAPPALAALKAVPGTDLLAATTPREWVERVSGLFADPSRCRELGAAGRRFVEEHHHWEDCLEPLLTAIFAPPEVGRVPPHPAHS
ncbi:MAG: sugar transferase [Gemmataceae bacterium]|nr:sugar transferase [Gemmataceae bacterium]